MVYWCTMSERLVTRSVLPTRPWAKDLADVRQSLTASEQACGKLRESERLLTATVEANSVTVKDLRDALEAGPHYNRSHFSST